MKKLLNLFSLTALAASVFLTSCSDDTTDPKPAPTIDAYIGGSGTTTYTGAGPVTISYTATAGEEITQIDAVATYTDGTGAAQTANLTGFPKTKTVSSTADNGSITYSLPVLTPITVTFTVTDKKSNKATKAVTINQTTSNDISTSTVVLLGAQKNTTNNSFLNLLTFATYDLAGAKTNSGSTDLGLFYSSTNGLNLAAPSNTFIEQIFTTVPTWTTRNTTKFYASNLTAAQFDAINNDATFTAATTGSSLDRVNSLAKDQVYAFTARGKNGLFKVGNVTASETGSAQLTIKVQK